MSDPAFDHARQLLLQLLRNHQLTRILIGVSGGPDSVFLLHLINSVGAEIKSVHVAHVNHELRAGAAEADQEFVESLAMHYKYAIHSKRIPIRDYATEKHQGIEATAREARYSYFHELVREYGLHGVFVAHTLNDQIETILLNFIRGAGPVGLAGMQPADELRLPGFKQPILVVRPLLQTTKEQALEYLHKYAIDYRRDATNDDTEFTRNKIRLEIIPKLLEINPKLFEAISRTSDLLQDENAERQTRIDQLLAAEDLFRKKSKLEYYLKQDRFLQFPTSTKRQLIMTLLRNLVGPTKEINYDHIQNTLEFLDKSKTGDEIHLPDNLRIEKAVGTFILRRREDGDELPPLEPRVLSIPGEAAYYGVGSLSSKLLSPLKSVRMKQQLLGKTCFPRPEEVYLDADQLPGELTVRSWKTGDKMIPLGMKKNKKVQDIFVDSKVPRRHRSQIPLVASADNVIWVAGAALHDNYRVSKKTKRIVKLTFNRNPASGEN